MDLQARSTVYAIFLLRNYKYNMLNMESSKLPAFAEYNLDSSSDTLSPPPSEGEHPVVGGKRQHY
jgi:hypothetical protein